MYLATECGLFTKLEMDVDNILLVQSCTLTYVRVDGYAVDNYINIGYNDGNNRT